MTFNLLYFVSHPIQYQAPLLRKISADPDVNLTVVFESDFSSEGYLDEGFGVEVSWDVPLREGYDSVLLADVDPARYIAKADAVWFHGWQSRQFRRLLNLASAIGTPVLMRGENWAGAMPDENGVRGWLKRLYLRRIFSKCNVYMAVGRANRDYYINHGISESCIFDMPYAVDNNFFETNATEESALEFRQELGIPNDQKIILYAGKFTARKRPESLLQAWEQADWLHDKRPALVFVGDGERKQALLDASERSAFKQDIYFTGFRNQTELPGVYRAAAIFVLASEKEPWGLGINEAMASGTSVIASDQCGAAFDLINEKTGLLVRSGDVAGLADALVESLEHSDEKGRAAKDRIAKWDFSADIKGLKSALEYLAGVAK